MHNSDWLVSPKPRSSPLTWALSLSLHGGVLMLLLLLAAAVGPLPPLPPHRIILPLTRTLLPMPTPVDPQETGGSQSSPAPARQGHPPRAKVFREYRPLAENPNHSPVPLEVAFNGVDFPSTDGLVGNPNSVLSVGALGNRGGIGIGDGPGRNGVGNGNSGLGIATFDSSSRTKVTRKPELIYQEEPQYSEAARKAHLQGKVRLRVDVGLDGRVTNIQVLDSIGLGLDENAIDTVGHWLFRPAFSGDRPVVSSAVIEVAFHLI